METIAGRNWGTKSGEHIRVPLRPCRAPGQNCNGSGKCSLAYLFVDDRRFVAKSVSRSLFSRFVALGLSVHLHGLLQVLKLRVEHECANVVLGGALGGAHELDGVGIAAHGGQVESGKGQEVSGGGLQIASMCGLD